MAIVGDRDAAGASVRRLSRQLREYEDAETWHALGVALLNLRDPAAAVAAFRNALRLDDTHIHSQRALGNLLFDAGRCEQALGCFDGAEAAG